jgi:hypothetical protein
VHVVCIPRVCAKCVCRACAVSRAVRVQRHMVCMPCVCVCVCAVNRVQGVVCTWCVCTCERMSCGPSICV